ncbi:MAG: AAA family ATPase [Candidatus Omnitrophica bacterium]|nr:AAA family ATPase [Candidatus Omnitrophota bacterium]
MYTNFYNLKEIPFNITSDPSFFFGSSIHEEAFSNILYGILARKGIVVMTGEIGTGKTTLCRALLNRLDQQVKTAFIFNPCFSDVQLLQLILRDLGIANHKTSDKLELIESLNAFLLEQSSQGNNVAIIIDEAQNLDVHQLEQIRLLSNLETEKHKLLQILLVGQPELFDKLKLPELRQLNQRVSVRYHITPLLTEDVKNYIQHRLKTAGSLSKIHFTEEAFEAVYRHSKGVPRLINVICDRALLAGFVKDTFIIDDAIIHQAAREVTTT